METSYAAAQPTPKAVGCSGLLDNTLQTADRFFCEGPDTMGSTPFNDAILPKSTDRIAHHVLPF